MRTCLAVWSQSCYSQWGSRAAPPTTLVAVNMHLQARPCLWLSLHMAWHHSVVWRSCCQVYLVGNQTTSCLRGSPVSWWTLGSHLSRKSCRTWQSPWIWWAHHLSFGHISGQSRARNLWPWAGTTQVEVAFVLEVCWVFGWKCLDLPFGRMSRAWTVCLSFAALSWFGGGSFWIQSWRARSLGRSLLLWSAQVTMYWDSVFGIENETESVNVDVTVKIVWLGHGLFLAAVWSLQFLGKILALLLPASFVLDRLGLACL